jgi:hypothetical protein
MYRICNNTIKDEYENSTERTNKNDYIKQQCVNYIYSTIDISRFKYELLEFQTKLPQLLEKKYFVSANFSGSNCLLIFTKIMDRYYQFLIDRKTLSYNSEKVNLSQVKMTAINIKLDPDIYRDRGTIFDGIYIVNKNTKTFIITDAYVFKGQDMINTPIDTKLLKVMTYFSSNYKPNDKGNDLSIMINKLYPVEDIEKLIYTTIPKIKDFIIKGVCFYPERSETRLIHMFNNQAKKENDKMDNDHGTKIISNRPHRHGENGGMDRQQDRYKNFREKNLLNTEQVVDARRKKSPQEFATSHSDEIKNNTTGTQESKIIISTVKKVEKKIYVPKSGTQDTSYVFEMKKTETVDVYYLFASEIVTKQINGENKKVYMRVKVGLALVPDTNKSVWCQELFDDNNIGPVFVNCKFHEDKQKWEPIQKVESANKPSKTSQFMIITA